MTRARFLGGIRDIAAADWNALAGRDYPFLRHEFLCALEDSASVGGDLSLIHISEPTRPY